MKTLLRHFVCFVCFVGLTATAHAQKNVQKSDATATRDEITADLKFGTGRTGTFLTGSALTLNSGSTLTLSGALAGTPTGGTLSLANLTLTLPATVSGGGSSFQALDADLTSWAAVTRAAGFDTFTATPSSANLASLITGETGSGALVFGTSPTLTTPVIASIVNTGTLTLPTATDTLIGRATTDTLTNKSISGATNTFSAIPNSALGNASLTLGSTALALGSTTTTIAGLTSLTGATGLTLAGSADGASLALGSGASGSALVTPGGVAGFLRVSKAMPSTSQFTATGSLQLINTDTTDGNWNSIDFADAIGAGTAAGIYAKHTDHANDYAELHLVTRGAGGLSSRGIFTSTGTLLLGTTTQPASLTGGVSIVASGSGATATGVQTGGLQSANFGLSTVSGGASYFGGAVMAQGDVSLTRTGGAREVRITTTTSGAAGFYAQGYSSATTVTGTAGGELVLHNQDATVNTFGAVTNLDAAGNTTSRIRFINESDPNNTGSIAFSTRPSGGSLTDALTIASTGAATFAGAVTHTLGTNLPPQTAPASPASGWVLYTDSGDGNKLKAKASTGTVVTLGTP